MKDKNDGKVIPFGKYKGQPIERLLADEQYTQWLQAQSWFADRFKDLAIFLAQNNKAQDTPEHNAMQARFLDDLICSKVARKILRVSKIYKREDQDISSFEQHGWDVILRCATLELNSWQEEIRENEHGHTLRFEDRVKLEGPFWHYEWHTILLELKPQISDDYPSIIREVKSRIARRDAISGTPILLCDEFTAVGATFEQVQEICRRSSLVLLRWEDLVG